MSQTYESQAPRRSPTPLPMVTVVTPTHGRIASLRLAMASVAAQQGVGVEHVVLGDRCPHLGQPAVLAALRAEFPEAVVRNLTEHDDPALPMDYLPRRLAYLRNLGARIGRGDFVAQLDDDNTFDPDHLASLVDVLARHPAAGAAHSWRKLLRADGTPFVPDGEDPWHPDPAKRAASYQALAAWGVFESGSNIVRDMLSTPDGRLLARVWTPASTFSGAAWQRTCRFPRSTRRPGASCRSPRTWR